ncbi:MAG: AAA family ATPase [Proteobacteria bacterium]|nr:AAA family ATPase [Pseudomonadota bacterium]
MRFKSLKIKNFRNFEYLEFIPENRTNIICGYNGRGKTNIAECLYILINGKSFRKCKREDLISYGKELSEIRAELEIDSIIININLTIGKNKKDININKKAKKRLDLRYYRKSLFLNSDLLFHCKNYLKYRIAFIDKLCYLHFGDIFYSEIKRYRRAIKQFRADPKNKIWLDLLLNQKKTVNTYREKLIKELEEEFITTLKEMKLYDTKIYYKYSEKIDFNFIRNDKRDLSLGEFKVAIFSLIISMAKRKDNANILIIDDFNSEWDNEKIINALEILKNTNLQSFLMSSEVINIYPHFLVDKGELKRYERREN